MNFGAVDWEATLYDSPAIVTWVLFNEGWEQYAAAVKMEFKELAPYPPSGS